MATPITDPKLLAAPILELLTEQLAEIKGDLIEEYIPTAQLIAQEAAMYASRIALGDLNAAQSLRHLKAQTVVLATHMAIRQEERVVQTVLRVVIVAAQILGKFLLAAV